MNQVLQNKTEPSQVEAPPLDPQHQWCKTKVRQLSELVLNVGKSWGLAKGETRLSAQPALYSQCLIPIQNHHV